MGDPMITLLYPATKKGGLCFHARFPKLLSRGSITQPLKRRRGTGIIGFRDLTRVLRRVWGLGFGVWGSGFGFRVRGSGFGVHGLGFEVGV